MSPRPPQSTLFPYTTLFRSFSIWQTDRPSSTTMATMNDEFRQRRQRSEEHTSELQSRENLVCRLRLEKKNSTNIQIFIPPSTSSYLSRNHCDVTCLFSKVST